MAFARPVLVALAVACIGVPALAKDRPFWTAQVTDFFLHAPAQTASAAPAVTTTAVAAFPDVVPERPKAPPDPALELLAENPYTSEVNARLAHENLFGTDLDREDPYAEQLRLANPYTEELHLANPYANARQRIARTARPSDEPSLENPYTAHAR